VNAVTATLRRNSPILLAFAIALLLFVAGAARTTNFASWVHVRSLLITASFIGLVGVGQTLCMLTGGIDLSTPSVLSGAAVLTAFLAHSRASALVWLVPLVLAAGLVVGLLNGIGVAYAGVPPIIMTLGMNAAVQGLLLIYTNGGFASAPPAKLSNFVNGNTLGFPTEVIVWLVVAAAVTIALSWGVFGRRLYAVGTNARAAALAGVDVRRVLVIPYAVSGVTAALAGVLLLGFLGQAFVNMGDEYLFSSAIAVAVGGASILGGRGNYIGTVAGALILTLITANLDLFSLGTSAVQISYGVILLGTVYLATLRNRRA
jgi:ribose transport system permease protein